MHYALEYGLDSAILHAAKIMPLASPSMPKARNSVPPVACSMNANIRFEAGNCVEDPLQLLIEHYADKKASDSPKGQSLGDTVEERLQAKRLFKAVANR